MGQWIDDRYVDGDLKDESANYVQVGEMAVFWHRVCDVSHFLTVSFDQETYDSFGFRKPAVLIRFIERTLEGVGYAGDYIIVVHDNRGSCYFHPHILMKDDGDAMYEKVKRAFHRYGDVNHTGNGPIEGFGAFIYVANRAFEVEGSNRSDDSDRYSYRATGEERPHRRHRSRGRNRGRGPKITSSSTGSSGPQG